MFTLFYYTFYFSCKFAGLRCQSMNLYLEVSNVTWMYCGLPFGVSVKIFYTDGACPLNS